MQQQERSKMLGTMPMNKLVPKVAVPIMISMLVQALYNVVDGIFVARYSADAFTAVSLVFPVQMLMIAVSTGLGVGINSLISRRLGEKRGDAALDAAKNGIFLELCGVALFCLFGLFLSKVYMHMFTDDANLQKLGEEYLFIVTVFCLGLFMSVVFERMLQATGNTTLSMATQLLGAIVNIILDPIMIFGLLGCPRMGIAGAAIATVIGQFCGMFLGFILNQTRNHELHAHPAPLLPPARRGADGHPGRGHPQRCDAGHLVGHECADEHDPAGLWQRGRQRAGRVLSSCNPSSLCRCSA